MKPIFDLIKRAIDVCAASILLLLTAPIIATVAALVRFNLGKPVIFRQERPGRNGDVFVLYKFRSMRDPRPGEPTGSQHDAERLTPFGKRIRSTSLDELPSLVNVIRGDMSLVGPRPLRVAYLDRYTPEQARRHEVRPGVTGLAQVSGRNALTWEEKFSLDVEYVDNRSLLLDARILLKTLKTVLSREGVSASDSATMPEFQGTDNGA